MEITGSPRYERSFDPARLVLGRRLAGLHTRDLAAAIGRSPATVARYESGLTTPPSDARKECATTLGLPIEFFEPGRPQLRLDTGKTHFRSLRATTTLERDQALAQVELLWELVACVEETVHLPEVELGSADLDGPATAARAVRQAWALGTGPLQHLVRQLEARGIVVTRLRGSATPRPRGATQRSGAGTGPATTRKRKNIDAFSAPVDGRPIIVLTDKGDVLRRRFSAAHELGHLILHPDPAPGSSHHEAEANAFAAELLMPESVFGDLLPDPTDLGALADLGQRWGVSIAAMAYRGRTLGVYSESAFRELMVVLTKLGWRSGEPVRGEHPGEEPALLARAVDLAAEQGMPLSRLAGRLRIGLPYLRELLGIRAGRPRLRLVTQAG
ncbi:XRE family transcriptional regulator [Actinoalloteichus hymeniacidonis]|uniref:Zn peptidase n=1 Tax=Actinoalloteichus hymeniacidonis TaxID=340345 RepID=A0AAC9HKW6_9PSEU|nr:XRE family transcriptional regulator [Actinoalloteichus hymeniacidonis]AOS61287.1 putative Zn peptidase [Actinoalloteichus hymeniacidonis]MBB5910709.1 Zn-dependent peptidase ImmA (M78 family)/transcriptional regulator with XRE-family HTH domain [Actinoalloteichus hymeniacidonis]